MEAERGAKRRLAARLAELEEAAAASASGRAAQAHAQALAASAEQRAQARVLLHLAKEVVVGHGEVVVG